jgi:TolB-like protein
MRSYQQFFAELKRRHVFKVAAIYGATAFVLLQLADLLVEALKLPGDFLTMITVLILLGFPVALILAWAFEATPTGVRWTDAASQAELAEIVAQPASKRWPAGLLALCGVAALLAGAWWVGTRTGPLGDPARGEMDGGDAPAARLAYADLADDPRPSIAVLPFADMSASQDQEYFGDGMAEEIINALVAVKDLRVAGRTSAFAYKGENKDLREIGTELGVGYLVEGSVRKSGPNLRITAQLIDAGTGSHLWSDSYDRSLDDVFAIQSEIAEAIADELRVPLGLEADESLVTPTGDLEAYDLYLAGRARLRDRDEGVFEAVDLFRAAVARDSTWAPSWAGLADATELQLWYQHVTSEEIPFDETLTEAERAARRALELNPQNSTALIVLGSIHRDRFEWGEAEQFFQQALALDPDNAEAHQQYGEWLHKRGRVAEAVRAMDRASILDPAPVRIWQLLLTLTSDARWDEAEELLAWAESTGVTGRFRGLGDASEAWPILRAYSEGRLDEIPDPVPEVVGQRLAIRVSTEPDLAVELFLERLRERRLSPDLAWRPYYEELTTDPRVHEYLASIGLGGVTVQRTPEGERVRPAILRQADASGIGTGEESAP